MGGSPMGYTLPGGMARHGMAPGMSPQAMGGVWGTPHGARPTQMAPMGGAMPHKAMTMQQAPGGMQQRSMQMQQRAPQPAMQQKGPPRREMDSLLEELKAKQRLQEQRKEVIKNAEALYAEAAARGESVSPSEGAVQALGAFGAFGALGGDLGGAARLGTGMRSFGESGPGDSSGVALFLRELPVSITEDTILQLFSRYGCVTSVDIMYTPERADQKQGYVTLETRDSAQRAKDALQDREVDNVPLWIEWAPNGAPPRSEEYADDAKLAKDTSRHIVVQTPHDGRKRRIIDALAKYVSQEGHHFEQIVMERESPDGDFGFLFKHDSLENVYYRWRTFAFTQGDNFKIWRTSTFRLHEGGKWWRPPPCKVAPEAKRTRNTNFSSGPEIVATKAAAVSAASAAPPVGSGTSSASSAAATTAGTAPAAAEAKAASAVAKPQTSVLPGTIPSSWTQADIDEERERQRLEERATQERQKRDRDKRGVAGAKRLTDPDWDRLETLLRSVTCHRAVILECMVFCLDHSENAIEIAECITESLTIVETELSLKLARFMVVSDVLHNTCSSKPAAWAYRREFEKVLPDIFEHIYTSLRRVESRLQADKSRDQVIKILRIWEDWGLFSPQFVRGLEATLVVGVRQLRLLAARGDKSREPAWLEPKLADWRRQHFSQLEKMCRTRGLRSSASHLEATRDLTLEEAKREWLVDRLVCYELHWHDKEQERAAADAAAAKAAAEAGAGSGSTTRMAQRTTSTARPSTTSTAFRFRKWSSTAR